MSQPAPGIEEVNVNIADMTHVIKEITSEVALVNDSTGENSTHIE